ncbi:MAG: DUF1307 domain-containing protein [Lachnospiraceae bacterium]|nr:DUF1307 domain-containing protein [Lachnospiraceae bacterium]
MKRMKRMLCLILAALMLVSMAGCGAKEQSTTLVLEQPGVTMEYKLDAKGDVVEIITQSSTIDCSMYGEDELQAIEDMISQVEPIYAGIDGVTYEVERGESTIIEVITIDASKSDTLKKLSESGMLPIDGDASKISLKLTVESLESQGWAVKE